MHAGAIVKQKVICNNKSFMFEYLRYTVSASVGTPWFVMPRNNPAVPSRLSLSIKRQKCIIHCTCCRKEILLLLIWQMLFTFYHDLVIFDELLVLTGIPLIGVVLIPNIGYASLLLSPIIGWLADVKLGRYKSILYASMGSFISSIIYSVGLMLDTSSNTSKVVFTTAITVNSISSACFSAAILPFITDQLVGATSDELSTAVHWYYWFQNVGTFLATTLLLGVVAAFLPTLHVLVAIPCLVSLALIIISDCLCQQWLDRTHKVTNPIKLIIQVLNYTRKHNYPERRSAFTYLDEEHPTRMDLGKEKYGGPFTEEEVEDVKTVLRLVPIVACISFIANVDWTYITLDPPTIPLVSVNINIAFSNWLLPLIYIPIYQFILYPLLRNRIPSMLKRIGGALFLKLFGLVLLAAIEIKGYNIYAHNLEGYFNCMGKIGDDIFPYQFVSWYWRFVSLLLYYTGTTTASYLLLEFIVAQAPSKMKGFVIGMWLAVSGISQLIPTVIRTFVAFTLCNNLPTIAMPVAVFLVFLFLSKRYKLRERNREININAIAEEHFERYLCQEEQYQKENPQYFTDSSSDYSSTIEGTQDKETTQTDEQ